MGHVLQAGQGQITARQAAVRAGIPMTVPALTVNKVCLSGLNAIATAAQYVELGQAGLLVAGGMESMSNAPYLVPKARFGARMGDAELVDAMVHDGLWDAFDDAHMGGLSDETNRRLGIDRAAQDEWAARSHERAAEAAKRGLLADEIVPVVVSQRTADVTIDQDEGIRPGTTAESLGRLRPAFSPDGTITAGNASQISDGAAAVVVTSRERAAADGLPVLASVVAYGTVAGPDTSLHSQPSRAIADACRRAGVAPADLDLVEINEAFAAVALARPRSWSWTRASSTSTAARSPSATRSGPAAPGSCSPWPWSCAAAAAASARPPCAAAAARATPCSSGSTLDPFPSCWSGCGPGTSGRWPG